MEGILIIVVVIVLAVLVGRDSLRVEEEEKVMIDTKLESALESVELTEQEERYLKWLSRMDSETVEVFAGLFEKIKNRPSP